MWAINFWGVNKFCGSKKNVGWANKNVGLVNKHVGGQIQTYKNLHVKWFLSKGQNIIFWFQLTLWVR